MWYCEHCDKLIEPKRCPQCQGTMDQALRWWWPAFGGALTLWSIGAGLWYALDGLVVICIYYNIMAAFSGYSTIENIRTIREYNSLIDRFMQSRQELHHTDP